jgi:aminoglycoside phosphotransferase (APT) family kinase protein
MSSPPSEDALQQPLDKPRFVEWLAQNVPDLGAGDLRMKRLSGGISSAVFEITRGEGRAVLRMPAWPPREDSLKAMGRESSILQALGSTDVPHPRLIAYRGSSDDVGVPFQLMEFIDGWLGSSTPPAAFASRDGKRALAFAMIDAIARLGRVDYKALGLEGLGKPDKFLDRQVDRWLGNLANLRKTYDHPGRELPGLQYVADWLRANQPEMQKAALIHSDVGFPNVMFAYDPPARVAAIIDWEIATLGDPLLDLGRSVYALPGRHVGDGRGMMHDNSDMPTREDLAEHYAEISGLDVSHLDYYCVLAAFKLACIIEFNYFRVVTGVDNSPLAKQVSDYIPQIIAQAEAIARASRPGGA